MAEVEGQQDVTESPKDSTGTGVAEATAAAPDGDEATTAADDKKKKKKVWKFPRIVNHA